MTQTTGIPARVKQIAALIRRMTSQERAWLLHLAPELREAQPISAAQTELMAYFRPRLQTFPDSRSMSDTDPFIAGLTVGEFFMLSETEQARLWDEAHTEAEHELGNRERPIHSSTLPAG